MKTNNPLNSTTIKIKQKKVSAITLMLLFCGLMGSFCSLYATPNMSEANDFSILAIPPDSTSDSGVIKLRVEITNNSNKIVEITNTLSKDQPFTLQIHDKQEVDINRHFFADLRKDRSRPGASIRFEPKETKVYNVSIAKVKDQQGGAQEISAGPYKVIVVLPIVSYVDGKYTTELLKSAPVQIEVK
jgi:hypothetical protein